MKNWQSLFYQVLKLFFILLMFTTGIGKLLDIPGFAEVIATYQLGVSGHFATGLGLGVALFELELAIYMVRKPLSVLVGPILTLVHSGYSLLAIITVSRGLELENCGCFGVFLARPMTTMTIVEDLILTGLSVMYWWLSRRMKK
jgi:hypothetical protein